MQHCGDTKNDPRVDAEVCRSLGIRSIVVLPIQGWRGINGIVEVFSTTPHTFGEGDLVFLQQLTSIAERARTFRPQGATSDAMKAQTVAAVEQGMWPASDRVRDVAAVFLGGRTRPLAIAGAVLGIGLIAFVIWLGWRGPVDGNATSRSLPPVVPTAQAAVLPSADTSARPDSFPKGDLKDQTRLTEKGSAGIPVKLASYVEVIPKEKSKGNPPGTTLNEGAITDAGPPVAAALPTDANNLSSAPATS